MCPFFFTFSLPPPSLILIRWTHYVKKVKQYPVLYDKQMKGYREQSVKCGHKRPRIYWQLYVQVDFTFHVVPGVMNNLGIEKNWEGSIILTQK